MEEPQKTVLELLREKFGDLTRAERQLAGFLFENYPITGLGSITAVAAGAQVSSATVARTVQKLGFKGFPEFREVLRNELEAKISNPITKHDQGAPGPDEEHTLSRFCEAAVRNLRQTLELIELDEFDAVRRLLMDCDRSVYVVGGRITRSLAQHLFTHLQMMRGKIALVPPAASMWPNYVLDMRPGDVLVVFDIRRYENDILRLSEMAAEKGAEIVLFTDQWASPVIKRAKHSFCCRVEAPSAWDSTAALTVILEALIACAQESQWETTRERMKDLEELFDRTWLFKKFK